MRCLKCGKELIIQVATKINCKNCKILTNMTTIITIQCNNCKHIFQIPIQGKSFLSVKKE